MSRYSQAIGTPIPQSQPLNQRQVPNHAGGFAFGLDKWSRLDRFLILGSDSNTYYQKGPDLTRDNAAVVEECWAEDPIRTADHIAEISNAGRAPRNDSAIFALALGAAFQPNFGETTAKIRRVALSKLTEVCRTSTHLFVFVDLVRKLGRGWGPTLKRAVANWYETKEVGALAYQAIKYRAREGYTHKRLLQTAHPKSAESDHARIALYRWICGKEYNNESLPDLVGAHILAMIETDPKGWARMVHTYNLPWEALPTEAKREPDVWRTLLPKMGMTALIRELGTLTQLDVLKPLAPEVPIVRLRLQSVDELRKGRIHPFTLLQAKAAYSGGRSIAGAGRDRNVKQWTPVQPVLDALEDAFYLSFQNIEPTNKRIMLGLDVSGSMGYSVLGSALSCREASAAMAMATARTESNYHMMAFSHQLVPIQITAKDSLDAVINETENIPFGGTDCALPMIYAQQHKIDVDAFVIYTDNETWFGRVHPAQALADYRRVMQIPAKLIVVAMTSTGFSIADPNDPLMLDVVGFDSACPALIADFIAR